MKKFLLSIFLCLMAVVAVQAQTKTYTYDFSSNKNWVTTVGGSTNVATGSSNKLNAFYYAETGEAFNAGGSGYFNSGYFLWGKSGAYIELPTFEGECITNVTAHSSSTHSTSVVVNVLTSEGKTASTSIKWATKNKDYSYDIAEEYQSSVLRLQVTSSHNSQITSLTITTKATGGEVLPTAATPTITPESCEFNEGESVEVSIATTEDGATIYYTTDGSIPTAESNKYTGAFEVTATTTVKAIAVKEGCKDSKVAEATYTAVDPNALTATISFADLAQRLSQTTTEQVWQQNGITFTNTGSVGNYYKPVRCYKNSEIIVEIAEGCKISKIEFACNSADYATSLKASIGSGAVADGKIVTVTLDGKSNSYTATLSDAQVRFDAITVTYLQAEGVVVSKPTITESVEFIGSKTIEITNNAEGATLYYSTDGASYSEYTGAFEITETTTVKAYAQDAQGNKSEEVEATFTKVELLSIAEAKAAHATAGAAVSVALDLAGCVVTVNHGQYLFIQDGSTGINIYASGAEYPVGTEFTAGYLIGTSTNYYKMNQIASAKFYDVETTTTTVEPLEVTISDLADYAVYEGRFVKLSNVDITNKTVVTDDDGDTYALYDRFEYNLPATATNCDIEGVVACYNTTLQVFPVDIYKVATVGEAGYATLYLDFATEIPAGVEAYIVSSIESGFVALQAVEGIVPAETGLILKGVAGEYKFKMTAAEATADVAENKLEGSAEATEIAAEGSDYYVLAAPEGKGAGLYKAELADGKFFNNANKAYLPVSTANAAAFYSFNFDWDGTTGIENIEGAAEENAAFKGIYDLTGRKINKITVSGIYIIDGKKVFIRK